MNAEQLTEIIAKFASGLPREIGKQLADVEILVCETPKMATEELDELLETADGTGIDPIPDDCKGVFIGEPMEVEEDGDGEGEFETASLPNGAIALIASNIKDADEAVLVVLHEIGHALGMDEDEVKALGLGVSPTAGAPTHGSDSPTDGKPV